MILDLICHLNFGLWIYCCRTTCYTFLVENCIFCKIVAGKSPSYKIYEDDLFYALLDIFPRTKGHTLLIPKKHYRWIYEVPEFGRYWETVLIITKIMQKALEPIFVTYVTHGLEVEHAHIHILPRYKERDFVPDIIQVSKEELQSIAEKLQKAAKEIK